MYGDHSIMMKTQTLDSSISKIKQVAALLNYGEPQILELFKNTPPSKLYWNLFPINNLREAVDATKRVLTKEKLDKHLSGKTVNTTPFMKMGDTSHSDKKVSINSQDSIGERIENLTSMMYTMSVQQKEGKKPFKPKVYPKRGRGQRRSNFSRNRNNDRQRQNFRQTQNRHRDGNRRGNYRQNFDRNNSRDRSRQNLRRNIVVTEVDQEKKAPHLEGTVIGNIVAQVQVQGPGVGLIPE